MQGHPRPASDQYALGIVVYEWLTGGRPFTGPVITDSAAAAHGPEKRSHSKPEPMWNMPAFPTPFIGREQEVANICTMLQQAEVRLLTLVGMGGIGKTRLGVEAASQLR